VDNSDDWLAIEYRVFADFPRAFFVHTNEKWLYALASFKEQQEDSAPFEVYDMGRVGPADLGRAWRTAPEQSRGLLGRVTLRPESFDETQRSAVSASALLAFIG
jgi:hypothetical protein